MLTPHLVFQTEAVDDWRRKENQTVIWNGAYALCAILCVSVLCALSV